MYERMLNKKEVPTIAVMTAYCGENGGLFTSLNEWLSRTFGTEQKIVFPVSYTHLDVYKRQYQYCRL